MICSCDKSLKTINLNVSEEKIPFSSECNLSSLKSFNIRGTDYLSLYKEATINKVVLFSLDGSFKREFLVPNIDSIGSYHSYTFKTTDSMISLYRNGLITSSPDGNYTLVAKYPNPYKDTEDNLMNIGSFNSDFMPIISYSNNFILPQYSMDINYWAPEFYSTSQFVEVNKLASKFKKLPLKYPTIYEVKNFGNANNITFTASKDYLYYSATASNSVFRYNFQTAETKVFTFSQDEFSFSCMPFDTTAKSDMSKIFQHLTVNDLTMRLIYDNKHNIIYQLIWRAERLQNKNGTFNTIKDKQITVNVISPSGEKIASYDVGNHVIWDFSVAHNGKLYIKNKTNEKFTCINFFESNN